MKVCSYVYNTLSRFARRIIDKMGKIENKRVLMVVLITVSLQVFLAGILQNQNNERMQVLFYTVALGLFSFGVYIYRELESDVGKEEQNQKAEREQQHKELIAELKGIREDLNKK